MIFTFFQKLSGRKKGISAAILTLIILGCFYALLDSAFKSLFAAKQWTCIASGELADAFVENKFYACESLPEDCLVHMKIVNKTSDKLTLYPKLSEFNWTWFTTSPFPHFLAFETDVNGQFCGVIDVFSGPSPNLFPYGGSYGMNEVSSYEKQMAESEKEDLKFIPPKGDYDFYFHTAKRESIEQQSKGKRFVIMALNSGVLVSNGTHTDALDAASPLDVQVLHAQSGAQFAVSTPIIWNKIPVNTAIKSAEFQNTLKQETNIASTSALCKSQSKDNWQCIKHGTLADFSVEDKVYYSPYLEEEKQKNHPGYILAHVSIKNKSKKPLIIKAAAQWFSAIPIQDRRRRRGGFDHWPLIEQLEVDPGTAAVNLSKQCDDLDKRIIDPDKEFSWFIPVSPVMEVLRHWLYSEEYKSKKPFKTDITVEGFCLLSTDEKRELFSFDFEDLHPFESSHAKLTYVPKRKLNNYVYPLLPTSALISTNGHFYDQVWLRRQMILDYLKIDRSARFFRVATNSQDADHPRYLKAMSLYRKGRYQESLAESKQLDSGAKQKYVEALNYIALGEYSKVNLEYDSLRLMLAQHYYATGKYKDAITCINKEAVYDKSIYILRANAKEALGLHQEAILDYSKALSQRFGASETTWQDYLQRGYFELDTELQLLTNAEIYRLRSIAYKNSGQSSLAKRDQERAEQIMFDPDYDAINKVFKQELLSSLTVHHRHLT